MPVRDEAGGFAREKVFPTLAQRYADAAFSRELWQRMGDAGFLGMTVPERYGGSGGSPAELASALREFAREGCDLGLTLCWITHLTLCVKSIERLGTEEQKRKYLPGLASGEWVGAAAVSEPGTGAHPSKMNTRAAPVDDGFVLDGRKMFTTGGPVADLLLVLAVTGDGEDGVREITAFLVETAASGVSVEPMELNFLKTAPHSVTDFTNVLLGPGAVLGAPGEGHSNASREAFARERSAVLAAVSGLLARAANEVADRYRQKYEGFELDGIEAASWIHHLSALGVYELVSDELVEASFADIESWKRSFDLLVYMGISYLKWSVWLEEFVSGHHMERGFPLDIIIADLKLMQVNEKLLMKEGKKRFLR